MSLTEKETDNYVFSSLDCGYLFNNLQYNPKQSQAITIKRSVLLPNKNIQGKYKSQKVKFAFPTL